MNKPVPAAALASSDLLHSHSPDIDALLGRIAEGAGERERERVQMVFTPEQLRVAKAARRARLAQYMARRTRQDTPPD